tara:strand:- start:6044 stop:7396 length:1353 start_codon:yes stop_codon:yes gene_type:complete
MAIDYTAGQMPKGPSNSNKMSPTPGTQQSALQNVGGLNLNPNMPAAPQMQKRQRSSYQQSVMPAAAAPPTAPAGPTRAGAMGGARSRVVSQGAPMDPGRGYNVFSGMDASQISDMNRTMGLSNMSALPPVNPAVNLSLTGGPGPAPGQMGGGQIMMGSGSGQGTAYFEYKMAGGELSKTEFDKLSQEEQQALTVSQMEKQDPGSASPSPGISGEDVASSAPPDPDLPTDPDPNTFEEGIYDLYNTPMAEEIGSALDQKYALQIQSVLAGLDRQAAMMGMLGSPAHTSLVNTAIAGSLENMAAEYANAIQASRVEEAGILGAIGDIEDGLAGSEEIRLVANSIFEQDIFAPAIATYSAFPERQAAFFLGVANNIKSKFQQEYSSAPNQAQRDAIVDKYRSIASQFQTLLNNYAGRSSLGYSQAQANIDLQAIYAAAGYTGDDESEGSFIQY